MSQAAPRPRTTNPAPAPAGGPAAGGVGAAPGRASKPINVKLVLLGEAAVGKSSMVLRFVANEFTENREPTIGGAAAADARAPSPPPPPSRPVGPAPPVD